MRLGTVKNLTGLILRFFIFIRKVLTVMFVFVPGINQLAVLFFDKKGYSKITLLTVGTLYL
jgi:hypothetical protein